MSHLVLILGFALLTGCVVSTQLYRSDSLLPFPGRFPSRNPIANRKGPYSSLVLDSHLECLKELKGTNQRLVETTETIQAVKNELKEEILKLRKELDDIKKLSGSNIEVAELKKELIDTKETIDLLINQTAENSELLIGSMNAINTLDKDLAGTAGNFTEYLGEINANIGELRAQISVLNSSSSTDMNSKMEHLESELTSIREQSAKYSERFDAITKNVEETSFLVADLRTDFDGLTANLENVAEVEGKVEELTAALKKSTTPSSIGKMPTTCADLLKIGHVKSGLYSVMGSKSVRNVYCDFTLDETKLEKLIGHADIKSSPTYFSVKRTSPFKTTDTPIPFDFSLVNTGGAMNLTSGVFTAPVAGIYSFSFHGLAEFQETKSTIPYLAVGLFVNSERVALALTEESNTLMDKNKGQRSPLSLATTIELQKGDQVWLDMFVKSGAIALYDNANSHTDFSGWLVQEDISQ